MCPFLQGGFVGSLSLRPWGLELRAGCRVNMFVWGLLSADALGLSFTSTQGVILFGAAVLSEHQQAVHFETWPGAVSRVSAACGGGSCVLMASWLHRGASLGQVTLSR